MPATFTPLRYPGGKSSLYPLVTKIINERNLKIHTYIEPFAGGAGLAMKLLIKKDVSEIIINDLDPAIASFWQNILDSSDDLVSFINDVDITLPKWEEQRNIYRSLRTKALKEYSNDKQTNNIHAPLDYLTRQERFLLGCAAFFLNRTNRSGIMAGGPVGGKHQNGKYKIDARFNKSNLIKKIKQIASLSHCIKSYNYDAKQFISKIIVPLSKTQPAILTYFDPPYVDKGPELYQNSLTEQDHRLLSEMIHQCPGNWIVTYDDCDLIKNLYKDLNISDLTITYCAYKTKMGKEILALSEGLSAKTQCNVSEGKIVI